MARVTSLGLEVWLCSNRPQPVSKGTAAADCFAGPHFAHEQWARVDGGCIVIADSIGCLILKTTGKERTAFFACMHTELEMLHDIDGGNAACLPALHGLTGLVVQNGQRWLAAVSCNTGPFVGLALLTVTVLQWPGSLPESMHLSSKGSPWASSRGMVLMVAA